MEDLTRMQTQLYFDQQKDRWVLSHDWTKDIYLKLYVKYGWDGEKWSHFTREFIDCDVHGNALTIVSNDEWDMLIENYVLNEEDSTNYSAKCWFEDKQHTISMWTARQWTGGDEIEKRFKALEERWTALTHLTTFAVTYQ
jgi:hypothetical protein